MENVTFVHIDAVMPRANPEKRLTIPWQIHDILETTMPNKPFDIPEEDVNQKILFGSIGIDGKIIPSVLFGFLEATRLERDISKVRIGFTFFTTSNEQNHQLIGEFKKQYVSIRDIVTNQLLPFSDPFTDSNLATTGEIDLGYSNPGLLEHINQDTPPIFFKFSLDRVYDLDEKDRTGKLNPKDSFVIGLSEVLNAQIQAKPSAHKKSG